MSEADPKPSNLCGVHVEVRDLWKRYNSEAVLQGVSFEVGRGEIFALMGPSGSGKSVLLKHMIGLERPDKGEVYIEDQPIAQALEHDYRLAMVFQSGALLNSLSVGENVGLYLSEHRLYPPDKIARRVSETLEVVGLKGMEDRSPSELSGGMKKRVAIARALIIEPQLIFYDEPTSELDPVTAATVGEEIRSLKDRIHLTSIIVTHDRNLALELADRLAFIRDGRVLLTGTPETVLGSSDPEVQEFLTVGYKHSEVKGTI